MRAPLADFVNHGFKFLGAPDEARALELFRDFGIALIPVLDSGFRLTGVITLQETLQSLELTVSKS